MTKTSLRFPFVLLVCTLEHNHKDSLSQGLCISSFMLLATFCTITPVCIVRILITNMYYVPHDFFTIYIACLLSNWLRHTVAHVKQHSTHKRRLEVSINAKDYSGAKFFYTKPISLNKAHSTKWKAFDIKTLHLYNHSLKLLQRPPGGRNRSHPTRFICLYV